MALVHRQAGKPVQPSKQAPGESFGYRTILRLPHRGYCSCPAGGIGHGGTGGGFPFPVRHFGAFGADLRLRTCPNLVGQSRQAAVGTNANAIRYNERYAVRTSRPDIAAPGTTSGADDLSKRRTDRADGWCLVKPSGKGNLCYKTGMAEVAAFHPQSWYRASMHRLHSMVGFQPRWSVTTVVRPPRQSLD